MCVFAAGLRGSLSKLIRPQPAAKNRHPDCCAVALQTQADMQPLTHQAWFKDKKDLRADSFFFSFFFFSPPASHYSSLGSQ